MNNLKTPFPDKKTTPPRVSVIVPTYNRLGDLKELLMCLSRQSLPQSAFEVIIIDDGSTDETPLFLAKTIRTNKSNISFLYQRNSGPGAARNLGMKKAKASIFAFTDTDCRPRNDWLEQIVKPFTDRRIGAVGGAEESDLQDPLLMRAIHFCMTSPLTTGGMRGKRGKKLARYYPRTFNMAISKEALNKTGGFLNLYHGEDVELSFRIKKAGFLLFYNEKAKVYHKRKTSLHQFILQLIKMGEARVTLVRLHPGLLEPLHLIPPLGIVLFCLFAAILQTSPFYSHFFFALVVTAFLFALTIGVVSAKQLKTFRAFFLVPVIFILQQAAYGIGFYRGAYRWILSKAKRGVAHYETDLF